MSIAALTALTVPGCQRAPTTATPIPERIVAQSTSVVSPPAQTTTPSAPTALTPTSPPASPDPVPGMKRAELGEPCTETNQFIFAISPTGQTLACRGEPPRYYRSAAVIGERTLGMPCTEEGLAQSTDGVPMMCLVKGSERVWAPYLAF
jgi:hypothetical protein